MFSLEKQKKLEENLRKELEAWQQNKTSAEAYITALGNTIQSHYLEDIKKEEDHD